jgi:hypothetical protein
MVIAKAYNDTRDGRMKQKTAIFGGHRLWHGYSPENNQDNNWGLYNTRPLGGYLDDLWIYTKYLDFSQPGQSYRSNNGERRMILQYSTVTSRAISLFLRVCKPFYCLVVPVCSLRPYASLRR